MHWSGQPLMHVIESWLPVAVACNCTVLIRWDWPYYERAPPPLAPLDFFRPHQTPPRFHSANTLRRWDLEPHRAAELMRGLRWVVAMQANPPRISSRRLELFDRPAHPVRVPSQHSVRRQAVRARDHLRRLPAPGHVLAALCPSTRCGVGGAPTRSIQESVDLAVEVLAGDVGAQEVRSQQAAKEVRAPVEWISSGGQFKALHCQ